MRDDLRRVRGLPPGQGMLGKVSTSMKTVRALAPTAVMAAVFVGFSGTGAWAIECGAGQTPCAHDKACCQMV